MSDTRQRILPPPYQEALAKIQDTRRAEERAEALANAGYVLMPIDQTARMHPRAEPVEVVLFDGATLQASSEWDETTDQQKVTYLARTAPLRVLVGRRFCGTHARHHWPFSGGTNWLQTGTV